MNFSNNFMDGSPTREYLVVTSLGTFVRFHLPGAIVTNTPYMAAMYIRKYLDAGENIIDVLALESADPDTEITHLLLDKKIKEYLPVLNDEPKDKNRLDDKVEEILSPEIPQHEEVKKEFYNTEIDEVEDDFEY